MLTREAIFVVGRCPGVGKSILIHYLTGKEIVVDKEGTLSIKVDSLSSKAHADYYECPSLPFHHIAPDYLKKIFCTELQQQTISTAKIIITIPWSDLTFNQMNSTRYLQDYAKLLDQLKKCMGVSQDLSNSIVFVITQASNRFENAESFRDRARKLLDMMSDGCAADAQAHRLHIFQELLHSILNSTHVVIADVLDQGESRNAIFNSLQSISSLSLLKHTVDELPEELHQVGRVFRAPIILEPASIFMHRFRPIREDDSLKGECESSSHSPKP